MKNEVSAPKSQATPRQVAIIICVFVVLFAIIAYPAFVPARRSDQSEGHFRSSCQERQTRIDGAIQQYILDSKMPSGTRVAFSEVAERIVAPNGYLKTMPECPKGGEYAIPPFGADTPGPFVRCSLPEHPFPQ